MTRQDQPITSSPEGRQLLAQAIECLIALLDLQEGDPDKEPTLGWPNPDRRAASQHNLWPEKQDGDNEPSLGWSDMEARYGKYDYLAAQGLEHEHDGSEPSLGWQNEGSQKGLRTSRDDCEEQCEDEGAQCEDEGGEHDGREPEDYYA